MALVLKDRVRETSTTTGTGTFTLAGAVAGFQSFSAIGTGNTTYYTIATSSDWEVGIGTWTSPDQLSRDTILASTNGGAAVNFGSGTKDVFATFPAEGFAVAPPIGGTTPNTITGTTITANTEIDLPAVVNTGTTTGRIYMADGGDGYDYLNLDTWDGYTQYSVNFPGGLTTQGGVSAVALQATGTPIVTAGYVQLKCLNGSDSVSLYAPASVSVGNIIFTLPNSTGSNNQVLKTDGSGNLSWTSTLSGMEVAVTSDPSAPATNLVEVYGKDFAGFQTLATRNALNTPFGLQSALWEKNFQLWTTSAATAGTWLGASGTGNGTYANANPTLGGTKYQTIRRSTYASSATINLVQGVVNGQASFFRGNTNGQGGFFFHTRCGFDTWTNGGRFFAGFSVSAVGTTDPSTVNQTVGFCVDAADNGAISFLTRGSASTKASTGFTIVTNKGYDCYIYCSPNSSQYTWQIVDINAGTSASGTATLNLPTNTQLMFPQVISSNAALTTVAAIKIGVARIYIESDY